MKGAVISMVVLVASVQFMVKPAEAITCGDVDSDLFACVPYLTGKGGDDPPPQCCAGVIKLKNSAVSVADKQAACKCVQAAASRILSACQYIYIIIPLGLCRQHLHHSRPEESWAQFKVRSVIKEYLNELARLFALQRYEFVISPSGMRLFGDYMLVVGITG
ncbi:hypothetical protein DKX38_020677 [Salix brachista]|uniref:Non-specific lipid-transfer protein n=1 Tax=Salix brachista TaxID=2182728 RepID=A0A5N5KAN5_9ROSI|nr:hypothetical protein DKX38_020677 [Salix brachista]